MQYYEKHESLPIEQHGGYRKGTSHLEDPDVIISVCTWLAAHKSREMTPATFCQALNSTILPDLGIMLKTLLSNRTACHWLLKLGYWHCVLKKGVYMDGHEHADVIKY